MALISTKRLMVDKTNNSIVIIVSVAAFLVIFSLVATKTFISQYNYQNKIIGDKRKAVNQLKEDINAAGTLKQSYDAFVSTPQNAIGGNPNGTGVQDGTNAKIVLDALPSTYDFPALTTSLESLLSGQHVKINSIAGTDDELTQASNQSAASPQAVPMPFQLDISGNYDQVKSVVDAFGHSIRPMQINKLDISGNQGDLDLSISAQTYYQPAKSLKITTKVDK